MSASSHNAAGMAGAAPGVGAWDYPYAGEAAAAQTYAQPVRPLRDPRHTTLAAVITFACLLLGLWAVLSYIGSMSKTLASVSRGTQEVRVQLTTANAGLDQLDTKTGALTRMESDTNALAKALVAIDTDMGSMVTDVGTIGTGMESMNGSLSQLDEQVTGINTVNGRMGPKLAGINGKLATQVKQVGAMRKDVVMTKQILHKVPNRLDATVDRLTWINGTINYFGCAGLINRLHIRMSWLTIPNGNADIVATITPKGAWGKQANGSPCL